MIDILERALPDHVALHPRELAGEDLKALRDVVVPESARELDRLPD